jgi:3D (Asp-Asp-Asp) domain-containing protein
MQTAQLLRLMLVCAVTCLVASCAGPTAQLSAAKPGARRVSHVRTTAYCGNEGSGHRNAVGEHLSGRRVLSAASDWSRFPLGTRFRVAGSSEEYVIDDYGSALVGTNTIDLSKSSRAAVRNWGVRHVDIDVLQWGSHDASLKILRPRKNSHMVRRMIASIEAKKT